LPRLIGRRRPGQHIERAHRAASPSNPQPLCFSTAGRYARSSARCWMPAQPERVESLVIAGVRKPAHYRK
jgi:hypothetical protein